ncbi:YkgJ family cysteine cluster protein [Crocinitomix sp.]|nr:YkgJ family cysteine cluster protein [Crocinitomix sp.]
MKYTNYNQTKFITFVFVKAELKKILDKSKAEEKENQIFLKKARKFPKKELDRKFHEAHDKAFEKIDCLDCANCCKTTSPIFKDQDIKRLAKLFKMKQGEFIDHYLKIDEDEDYVLKSSPCPFLLDDNKCFVYDVRPQACREYPHTNRKNMFQILTLTKNNTLICPAVADIVNNLKNNKA